MRILYFGVFNPGYSRNRVIRRALESQGVSVVECRVKPDTWFTWLGLFMKHWRLRNSYDLMLVGFPGQEIMFLAKLISRKPVIFDAFTSHYGGYILDRQKAGPHSMRARWYRFLDRRSCSMADLVLLDTDAHIDFFVREFGLSKEKFRRLFVGTDTDVFKPTPMPENEEFVVHFHGNYIPLQGVRYVIEAAHLLEGDGVLFNIIGRGQTYDEVVRLSERLGVTNVRFFDPVPYPMLAEYIARADVCLGIFGNTLKTHLVIPNKVFEALACQRPVITARTAAIGELLAEGEEVILCVPADAEDLAEKIRVLKKDPVLRQKLAQRGHDAFLVKASEGVLGLTLLRYMREVGEA